jgi:hypothetical protein
VSSICVLVGDELLFLNFGPYMIKFNRRSKLRREDNIKMNLKELLLEDI